MATATTAVFEGRSCDVKVESDLDENWAVCILSGALDELSITRRPASPLIVKVRAKTRWTALEQVLRSLKEAGRITDYSLEPRPEAELAAIEAEKAKAAAKKVAPAKAAAVVEEA
jgi:hypothetical protein